MGRGIGVIADFSDATLEGYTTGDPASLTTEDQFREILDMMEAHWLYVSVGSVKLVWDIVRVTLDEKLEPDVFLNYELYRVAVANKVKEKIKISDYDVNGDGIIDTMFIVASSHGNAYSYMAGGASQHGQARIFVDG